MYSRILVALDGSKLAEQVLPFVEPLAERFGSDVTLVAVVAPAFGRRRTSARTQEPEVGAAPYPITAISHGPVAVADCLGLVARRFSDKGIIAEVECPKGHPAAVLVEHAQTLGADLIAMTTRGHSGLARLALGSVADEVLRHAPCPVLLVRAVA